MSVACVCVNMCVAKWCEGLGPWEAAVRWAECRETSRTIAGTKCQKEVWPQQETETADGCGGGLG